MRYRTHGRCMVANCRVSVTQDRAICKIHWRMLPNHRRYELQKLYRGGNYESQAPKYHRLAEALVQELNAKVQVA